MRPVVLVYLPNSNYLVGTFDNVNFSQWWISTGFLGVEFVLKGMQIYGEIHLAICKMTDGTYSIFQSMDYAQSWHEVFNTEAQIYDIVRIAYGWAVINTSDGFYKTVNAGTDWTLLVGLPDAPDASAIANIGAGDILICTDGRYIWRSLTFGLTWAKCAISPYRDRDEAEPEPYTGDMNLIHPGRSWGPGPYTGPSMACVAGANTRVYVGHGPYICVSYDNGDLFTSCDSWDIWVDTEGAIVTDEDLGGSRHNCFPPYAMIHSRRNGYLVSQILVASVDKADPEYTCFVVKTVDIKPRMIDYHTVYHEGHFNNTYPYNYIQPYWEYVYDYEPLMVRVFKTFSGLTVLGDFYGNFWFRYIYCQLRSPSTEEQLSSYDLLIGGTGNTDRLLFSSASRTDPVTGKISPSLKYSRDSGITWIDIDVNTLTTFIGGMPVYNGGPLVDDDFASHTWIHGECNNSGEWDYEGGYCKRNISYDMDWLKAPSHPGGVTYQASLSLMGPAQAWYLAGGRIEQFVTIGYDQKAIVCEEVPVTYEADSLVEGRAVATYRMTRYLEGYPVLGYQMGAFIIEVVFPDIEDLLPQAFRTNFPFQPKQPYDSRKED